MTKIAHGVSMATAALLILPAGATAQQCAKKGNQHTRAADVEITFANRGDDPQTPQERYTRALEKLKPAFEADPDLPRPYLLAAVSYLGLRDYTGADSMLTRLVSLAPSCEKQARDMRFNAWATLYNRAITQMSGGDSDKALATFELANTIYRDARSLTSAGSLYQNRGDVELASGRYREAIDVGGDESMVRVATINLAEILRSQDRDAEALALYAEHAEKHPDDVMGNLNYAIVLIDAGRGDEAQAIFMKLLSREDLTFAQWSQVGIGLYRAQSFGEAAVAFQKAHEINPVNKEILTNLANTKYQQEDYEGTIPLADTLVRFFPLEAANYNLLAAGYRELSRNDEALQVLKRRDALDFEVLQSQLAPRGEGGWVVRGQVMNRTVAAGTEVLIPLELMGEDGAVVANETVHIEMPPEGEVTAFEVQLESADSVAGFRYAEATETGSGS
ncbi:MAG: tetratricopeptide repeat protein [Gemmatimonadota bacterium]